MPVKYNPPGTIPPGSWSLPHNAPAGTVLPATGWPDSTAVPQASGIITTTLEAKPDYLAISLAGTIATLALALLAWAVYMTFRR